MNPYITYRDTDDNGELQYYILQRTFPHYIGLITSVPVINSWQATIAGYNLYVMFNGTIRGNIIPNYKDVSDEIQQIMDSMATWYYHNRILKEPNKYKKFKVKSNVPISDK